MVHNTVGCFFRLLM